MLRKCNTACFDVHYLITSFEFLIFPTASSKTLKSNTFASFPYVDCCRSPLSLQIFHVVTALGPQSPLCSNFSTIFSHLTFYFLLFFVSALTEILSEERRCPAQFMCSEYFIQKYARLFLPSP